MLTFLGFPGHGAFSVHGRSVARTMFFGLESGGVTQNITFAFNGFKPVPRHGHYFLNFKIPRNSVDMNHMVGSLTSVCVLAMTFFS